MTNNLIFKRSIQTHKHVIDVKVRLNDECRNGHEDFAITADVWQRGKPKTDRYLVSADCCHDEILKAAPSYKIFVDLHLCDFSGAPMYAVENGFYYLKDRGRFCEFMRCSPDEYGQFLPALAAEDKLYFHYLLQTSGLPERWEKEARQAIATLEELTGEKFQSTATERHFTPLDSDQLAEIERLVNAGHYSPASIEKRKKEKINDQKNALRQTYIKECKRAILDAETKRDIAIFLIDRCGFANFIYYTRNGRVSLNFSTYGDNDMHTVEDVEALAGSGIRGVYEVNFYKQ